MTEQERDAWDFERERGNGMMLADYLEQTPSPVMFFMFEGHLTGCEVPLSADWRRGLSLNWSGLDGSIDADGDWLWDGEGHPSYANRPVTYITVYSDERAWNRLMDDDREQLPA